MTPRTPQVGDTITTAEELDALPGGAVVLDAREDAFKLGTITNRYVSRFLPLTVLYIPGHPPRPEGVVAAQALREWADAWDATLFIDGVLGPDETSLESTHARRRADRIEGGAV